MEMGIVYRLIWHEKKKTFIQSEQNGTEQNPPAAAEKYYNK